MANFPKVNPPIGRSTGLTGATGATGASGMPPGWVGAKANYGAAGDGSTNDTTAIQNLFNYLKANGGTGYFEPGVYNYTQINLDQATFGFTIRGAGGGEFSGNTLASRLRCTASGSTGGLSINSSFGFEICNLGFGYTSSSFTGNVVTLDGGPHGADTQYGSIHHCAFSPPAGAISANASLYLSKTNVVEINNCYISGGIYGLQLGNNATYVNGVTVGPNNLFTGNTTAQIALFTDDGEAITITGNTFEGFNTPYGIRGDDTIFASNTVGLIGFELSGNWFGDQSTPTSWVHNLITWSGWKSALVSNNYFGPSSGAALDGIKGNWTVIGNSFDSNNGFNNLTADWDRLHLISIGNGFVGGAPFPGTGRPTYYVDFGGEVQGEMTVLPRVAVAGSAAAVVGALDTTGGGANEGLVLGMQSLGTLPAGVNKALAYFVQSNSKFILQAPWSGSTGVLQLVGGATPTVGLSFKNGNALQFYGTGSEVTQASRAGQLTDSTGGTVTSTLAAGISDAVAKNAIASLAAKVNALETIIHNLGLSA